MILMDCAFFLWAGTMVRRTLAMAQFEFLPRGPLAHCCFMRKKGLALSVIGLDSRLDT